MPNISKIPRTHYRACNLCEAICGLQIEIGANNEILSIKADEKDPFSRGHICPKALALKDIYEDPNRLKQPVKRHQTGWETISWEQAFTEVVANLKAIQDKYGADSIASYTGNPAVHNSGTLLTGPGFLKTLNSKIRYTATSADQLPHHFVSWAMFGHHMTLPVPDIDHTNYFLIIGANPLTSNGSMMTVPDINKRLRAIQARHGKVVVVDPRRTDTAKHANEHYFIKPATDVFLLIALAKLILAKTSFPSKNIYNYTNIEAFTNFLDHFQLIKLSEICQIPLETIEKIANDLQEAPTAVVYGRMGVSTQAFGGLCQWLINILNILTDNFDKTGGAMFTSPAFSLYGSAKKGYKPYNRWQSKVRSLPEFDGELPVATMAEDILHKNGPKAFVSISGNPVLSTPNGPQLEKALERLEFMVAFDIYINETTKYANIILPPTTGLEVAHYDMVFNTLAVRNTAKYSEPAFEKTDNQRHDWEIFSALKNRMLATDETEVKPTQNPEHTIDYMLKNGPYGSEGMSIQKLKNEPHGVDLGPLLPNIERKIYTESGQIDLFPQLLLNDLPRALAKYNILKNANNTGLTLIGRRQLRGNNSWMHNSHLLTKGRNRCTVMMHPNTAQKYGVSNEEMVEISSKIGKINLPAEITEDITPNVLCIPHGFGHRRPGVQLAIASSLVGESINDLTDHNLIDQLTGNAAFSGVEVWLKKTI